MECLQHKEKVVALAGRDNVPSESVANMEIVEARKVEFVRNTAPGTFEIVDGYISCRYCVGNSRNIALNPQHGSFENNVKQHLKSKEHTVAAKGKKQGTLDSFVRTSSQGKSAVRPQQP